MRILIINYEFPPLGGGAGRVAQEVAKNIVKLGNEVTILTSHFKGLKRREEIDGYVVIRIPVIRRRMDRCNPFEMATFTLNGLIQIKKIVEAFHPQILFTFFGLPSGPIALFAKERYGLPYLLALHGGDVPGHQPQLKCYYTILMPFIKLIWRNASKIVTISEGLKELALKLTPDLKINYIPNGIDLGSFKHTGTKEKGRKIKLLAGGRLSKEKGLQFLIKSVSLLNREIELEIIGDGPERRRLEKLVSRLNLKERIRFSGWISSKEEIISKYQSADIFILPSLTEGMPMVVLEAMACGLPIVASNIPGVNNLIKDGENGLLVSCGDVRSLSEAISNLINHEELRIEIGRKSRELASQYDWKIISEKYLLLLKEIVSQ